MAEKKFWWIKLKDTFMTSDSVDFLMGQKNGANYVVLYQMLCLKTVNLGGKLERRIGEFIIPYDVDKIVRDCKYFEKDTVIVALELYKQLGLIYQDKDGCLQIANFKNLIGGECESAERVRKYRLKKEENKGKLPLPSNKNVTLPLSLLSYSNILSLTRELLNDDIVINRFIDYIEMREAIKKPIKTRRTLELCINRLREYAKTPEDAIKILDYSIIGNYQGLFPLKDEKPKNNFIIKENQEPSNNLREKIEKLAEKRHLAQKTAKQNLETALKDKEFSAAQSRINELILQSAKQSLTTSGKNDFDKEIELLEKVKKDVLKRLKISLEIEYECKICSDTGFLNGVPCECIKD